LLSASLLAAFDAETVFPACLGVAASWTVTTDSGEGAASGDSDGLASPLPFISPASILLKLDAAGD
jgi:hypothetical protein